MNPRTLTALVAGAAVLGVIVTAPAQDADPWTYRQPPRARAASPAPMASDDPFGGGPGYPQPLAGPGNSQVASLLSAARTLEAGGFADRAAALRAEAHQLAAIQNPVAGGDRHAQLIAEIRALRSEVGRLMDMVAALRSEMRGSSRHGGLPSAESAPRPSGFGSSRAPMAGGYDGAGPATAPSVESGRRRGGPPVGGGIMGGSGRSAPPVAGAGRRRSAPARQAPPGAGGGSGGRSGGGPLPPGVGGGTGGGGGPLPPATAPASAPGGGTGR